MQHDRLNASTTARLLQAFFEDRMHSLRTGPECPDVYSDVSAEHLASHLVERAFARVAARASALDACSAPSAVDDGATAWKRCLLVSALTELRRLGCGDFSERPSA